MRKSRKSQKQKGEQKWSWRQKSANVRKKIKQEGAEHSGRVGGSFFSCYLLTSRSPRHKGHTYIGFTVNPMRRLRQHNGEITSGATKTKKKRPWEMVLCIHGFPTHVSALQFEWAWQNPKESIAVRETAASFKTLGGVSNKIRLALTMLTLPSWRSLDLTVSFFCTNYMNHAAGCPDLPPQMKIRFSSPDELPCYSNPHGPSSDHDDDDDVQAHSSHDSGDNPSNDTQTYTVQNTSEFGFVESNPSTDAQSDNLQNISEFGIVETNPSTGTQSYTPGNASDFDLTETNSSTEFGFVETIPSIDTQSYTLQNPSFGTQNYTLENTSEHVVYPLVDEDTLYTITDARHEEQFSPLYQFPDDELLQPSPRDHVTPLAGSLFLNRRFPILKKHINHSHHLPVDAHNLNNDTSLGKEDSLQHPNSFVREKPLTVRNEDFTCILIDESPDEKWRPTRNNRPKNTAAPSVEVIDLYTPSPDCRIIAGSKKRRISSDGSNFIDLTRSPHFLEL